MACHIFDALASPLNSMWTASSLKAVSKSHRLLFGYDHVTSTHRKDTSSHTAVSVWCSNPRSHLFSLGPCTQTAPAFAAPAGKLPIGAESAAVAPYLLPPATRLHRAPAQLLLHCCSSRQSWTLFPPSFPFICHAEPYQVGRTLYTDFHTTYPLNEGEDCSQCTEDTYKALHNSLLTEWESFITG